MDNVDNALAAGASIAGGEQESSLGVADKAFSLAGEALTKVNPAIPATVAVLGTLTPHAHAGEMPAEYLQKHAQTAQDNQQDKNLSGSLKDTQAVQSQTESVGDKYPLFDKLMGRGEGGYDSYNKDEGKKNSKGETIHTPHHGDEIENGKKLSDFTIAELMDKQAKGELFALGHYQITPPAMKDALRLSGVSPDEKFTPEIQDKLFEDGLLKKAGVTKGHSYGPLYGYITGEHDDIDKAVRAASQEWSSVPVPKDEHVNDRFGERDLKAGDSYYKGVGSNRSHISVEDAKAAIEEMRTNYLAAHSADNHTAENAQSETPAETSVRLEVPQPETQTETTQPEKSAIEHAKEILGSALGVGAASAHAVDEKSDDKPQTDNLAEQQKAEDEQLKQQARNEENEWQNQADKNEQLLAQQKAAEEQARLERKKKEEEDNKKAKNSTITTTTDKDGNTKTTISVKDRNKPLDKIPDDLAKAAPWMVTANSEAGTREIAGKNKHNPRIIEYHADTVQKIKNDDSSGPWCSSFVSWVLTQHDINGTHSASSQSWAKTKQWDGQKLDKPAYGSIAVFQNVDKNGKPTGTGHVAFVAGIEEKTGKLILLGGNQSINNPNVGEIVNYASRGRTNLVGFYHPKNFEPNYDLPTVKVPKGSELKGTI